MFGATPQMLGPCGAEYGSGVHFVIMGCGRVGATLATQLDSNGHSVAVIDQEADAFRRLASGFDGMRVTGVGFDRDVLAQAGIEDAYGLAAVSSGDNSNILAARVARETFGVDNVVARIYDPGRAEVYQRLGITTVATVRWTADEVLRRLAPMGSVEQFRDSSGALSLVRLDTNPAWVGRGLRALEAVTGVRVAYLTRRGVGVLPPADAVVQERDIVHAMVPVELVDATQRLVAEAPPSVEEG